MTAIHTLNTILVVLVVVGIVTRRAATDNQRSRVRFGHQDEIARFELGKEINMDLVVLLCCPPLAIVGGGGLELNTLECNNIGAWRVGVQITAGADVSGAWSDLWSLVTLRGMLDQLDHLFAVLDLSADAHQEGTDCQQVAVPLK